MSGLLALLMICAIPGAVVFGLAFWTSAILGWNLAGRKALLSSGYGILFLSWLNVYLQTPSDQPWTLGVGVIGSLIAIGSIMIWTFGWLILSEEPVRLARG